MAFAPHASMRWKVSLSSTAARPLMARRTVAMGPPEDFGALDLGVGKPEAGTEETLSPEEVFVEPTSRIEVLRDSICLLILTEPAPNHMLSPTIRLAAISLPAEKSPERMPVVFRAALLMANISANAGVLSAGLGGATASSTRSNSGRTTNLGARTEMRGAIDSNDTIGPIGERWQM